MQIADGTLEIMNNDELLRRLTIDRDAPTQGGAPAWRRRSIVAAVGAFAAVAIAVAGYAAWSQGQDRVTEETTDRAAPSQAPAVSQITQGRITASGYVVARRQTTVSALETGRVSELLVDVGDTVREGQILGRLDSRLIGMNAQVHQTQIRAAEASAQRAQTELRHAEAEADRTRQLFASGFSSAAALDIREAETAARRSQVLQEQANVRAAILAREREMEVLDRYTIRAPFDGVITVKNAQVGETVSPVSAGGGFTRTGIYTIVDMSSLEIEVRVSEDRATEAEVGAPVTVTFDAFPGRVFPGVIKQLVPLVDRDRGTMPVRVTLVGSTTDILPNMAAKVTFGGSRPAIRETETR